MSREVALAQIWKEPSKDQARGRNLIPKYDILVRVASFTFRFSSAEQLKDCLAFLGKKTHPSSSLDGRRLAAEFGADWRTLRGWEIERWFERLPMYLLEEPKRQRVVKALNEALRRVEAGEL